MTTSQSGSLVQSIPASSILSTLSGTSPGCWHVEGFWFSSERIAMQNLIDSTQKNVTGDVRLKLYKGNIIISGRKSPLSKYKLSLVSFDEVGDYNQKDAEGFIKISSLRLKN